MVIVGITGGTGSGKSTALNAFKLLGGFSFDCDKIYHNLLVTSDDLIRAIKYSFPEAVNKNIVDRKILGQIVFSSVEKLEILNSITHPFVIKEVTKQISNKMEEGFTLFAVDAIDLFESGASKLCNTTVFITAPKEIRAARIISRDKINYEDAMMRIEAQNDDNYFASRCDYTLVNDFADEDSFSQYCIKFFSELLKNK